MEGDDSLEIVRDAAVVLGTRGPSMRLSELASHLTESPPSSQTPVSGYRSAARLSAFRSTLRRTLSEQGNDLFDIGRDGPDPWVSLRTGSGSSSAARHAARSHSSRGAGRSLRESHPLIFGDTPRSSSTPGNVSSRFDPDHHSHSGGSSAAPVTASASSSRLTSSSSAAHLHGHGGHPIHSSAPDRARFEPPPGVRRVSSHQEFRRRDSGAVPVPRSPSSGATGGGAPVFEPPGSLTGDSERGGVSAAARRVPPRHRGSSADVGNDGGSDNGNGRGASRQHSGASHHHQQHHRQHHRHHQQQQQQQNHVSGVPDPSRSSSAAGPPGSPGSSSYEYEYSYESDEAADGGRTPVRRRSRPGTPERERVRGTGTGFGHRGDDDDASAVLTSEESPSVEPAPEPAFHTPQRDVYNEESDGEISMDEDEDPSKVDHLVFVMHGIGGGLLNGARVEHHRTTFDTTMHTVLEESFQGVGLKMHFELIEWRSSLAEYSGESDRLVRSCTLKGVKRMRDFANDIFLDAVYFLHNVYNRAIVEEVTRQLNEKYETFRRKHRNFSGKVSIFAHSLGAVIIYDILQLTTAPVELYSMGSVHGISDISRLKEGRSPPHVSPSGRLAPGSPSLTTKPRSASLRFHVENLFTCGSPLGCFLSIRRAALGPDFIAPRGVSHYYNLFHPYDPVAYRIEPLVSEAYADIDPEKIPVQHASEEKGKSLRERIMQRLGLSRDKKRPGESGDGEASEDPTAGRPRLDFEISETMLEGLSEYVVATRAHHCYWGHKDIALFVLKKLLANSDFFYLVT